MKDDGVRIPKIVKADAASRPAPARSYAPGSIEARLLARIDGTATVSDLVVLTGLAEDAVQLSLAKLVADGLVALQPADSRIAARPNTVSLAAAGTSPALRYDPAELDEDVDLTVEQRQRILDLFYRVKELTHYALLGIERTADKKVVKRAYYELTSHFHPDKFFRKRLGAFKGKMETLFARITQAHDVLVDKAQRAEYDAYLDDFDRSRGIEAMLKDVLAEMEHAEMGVQAVATADMPPVEILQATSSPTPPSPVTAVTAVARESSHAPEESTPNLQRRIIPPADARARRELLARRLLGSRAPPARPTAPAAGAAAQAHLTTHAAVDALRRRYTDRVEQARKFQANKYAANGAAALAQKDAVAAANAYRVALSLQPDDAALKAAFEEAQSASDTILGESYERQALYQEKSESWTDAATSWTRVTKARPSDARAHERAANALVRAGGNLHDAAALAKRAVELSPEDGKFKLTLANVYVAAGLTLNAKRELEAAAHLLPGDDTVQALLKRVSKAKP